MPIRIDDLKRGGVGNKRFLRGQILDFLKKNSKYAYTLKELYTHFLKLDSGGDKKYISKENGLYHIIYGYLRSFILKKQVVKDGNFYYYDGKKR